MARDRYDHSDDHSDVITPMRPRRMEVLTGAERRRKWSDEAKIVIVAEALADGVVVSDVARRHDVMPSQLFGWMRQFRDAALATIAPPPSQPHASTWGRDRLTCQRRLLGIRGRPNLLLRAGGSWCGYAPDLHFLAALRHMHSGTQLVYTHHRALAAFRVSDHGSLTCCCCHATTIPRRKSSIYLFDLPRGFF